MYIHNDVFHKNILQRGKRMCVDDYKFRHFSARREKICRRFVFHEEYKSERVYLVNISQFQFYNDLCLCEILMHLNKKGLSIKDYKFQLPDLNITIEAGDRCLIPFDVMAKKQVNINMLKIEENNDYIGNIPEPQHESMAKPLTIIDLNDLKKEEEKVEEFLPYTAKRQMQGGRSKEREKSISEALFLVKHWRYLHDKCNLSLKNAAEIVGLSKKTLDDYFLVIRVGQLHVYDFSKNLQQRIGHLRNYIKNQRLKIRGRLSKNVESFDLVPEPAVDNILPINDWSRLSEIKEQSSSYSDVLSDSTMNIV